jgi:hypothetical protein
MLAAALGYEYGVLGGGDGVAAASAAEYALVYGEGSTLGNVATLLPHAKPDAEANQCV